MCSEKLARGVSTLNYYHHVPLLSYALAKGTHSHHAGNKSTSMCSRAYFAAGLRVGSGRLSRVDPSCWKRVIVRQHLGNALDRKQTGDPSNLSPVHPFPFLFARSPRAVPQHLRGPSRHASLPETLQRMPART